MNMKKSAKLIEEIEAITQAEQEMAAAHINLDLVTIEQLFLTLTKIKTDQPSCLKDVLNFVNPVMIAEGRGGQPQIYKSTGSTSSTCATTL